MPRLHGSLEAIDFFERLLNLLLNGQGARQETKNNSTLFDAQQEFRSPVYTRKFKVGKWWINYYFDKRTGEDRKWGRGHIDVPLGLLEELEAKRDNQKGDKYDTNNRQTSQEG